MDQEQARRVANKIKITHPAATYTEIAYSYAHGTYAVIVYNDGDIVALIDTDAAASYLLEHPSVESN